MKDEIELKIKERGSRTEFRKKFISNDHPTADLIGRTIRT